MIVGGGDGKLIQGKEGSLMSTSSVETYIKVQSTPGIVKIIQRRNRINYWKMLE